MYSTEINGEVVEFGTSGWLYQSNKLMYDRGTKTLWHQFLGKPVVGELVGSGIRLKLLPVTLTTWDDWVAAHPDTTVLHIETGVYSADSYLAEEHPASIYSSYRSSEETMFPVPERSSRLPTKSRVLGLTLNGRSRAYPEDVLTQEPVVNDSLGGMDLVVVTIGGGSRAYQAGGHIFIPNERGTVYVFEATSKTLEIVARNQLGDECMASPVICGDRIYLRVASRQGGPRQETLYCIGVRE